MADVIIDKSGWYFLVWLDGDADNFRRWLIDEAEASEKDIAPPPKPSPTFMTSEDAINSLVIEWLRGPPGPVGPIGAEGAKGEPGESDTGTP